MDLPNLFLANSDKKDQLMVIFIHLTSVKIQSFLLSISNDGTEILEKSEISEYEGVGNCLIRADESLQQLGKKSESIDSVIFGLNHSWVKKGEVIEKNKPLLKKLTDELSLKPLGFIVISEAIVQQKISHNSMFSGIIAVLSKKNLTLSLVHQGKVKSVENVGRSSDEKGDFLEGLARFSAKSEKEGFYLPTRIVLSSMDLDEEELKKHQQIIYDSDWEKQPQFLQPPTVEVLSQKDCEEMITKEAAKAVALQKGMTQAAIAVTLEDSVVKDSATELDPSESGFSDVKIGGLEEKNEKTGDIKKKSNDSGSEASSFGVPISTKEFDKELITSEDNNLREPNFEKESELAIDFSATDKKHKSKFQEESKDKKVGAGFNHSTGFKNGLGKHVLSGRNESAKKTRHYKNYKLYSLVGFVAGLIALLIIGFFGIRAFVTAEVNIGLKMKPVSKDLEITLDTSIKETDIDNLVLAASEVTKTKQAESMMQTTGVKIIGEKAKGKVSVYNNTNAEKLLPKGTVLVAGELQFELDEDITIAAATSPNPGTTEHGKVETTITALQIGADSNIAKDTELEVIPFDKSSYYAYVIDEDFIGGSSREVKVVSEDDRLELLLDLRKELIEEINKEFHEESKDGVYILPSNNIISETAEFSFEVGDESEELSLILNIELKAITYTAQDLKPIATEVLDSEIPDNYRLYDDDPQILSAPTESNLDDLDKEKPVTLSANISSFAIPELSEDLIKDEISGKTISDAKNLLKSRNEVKTVEVILTPSIAKKFVRRIPSKSEKIIIKFKSE